MAARHEGTEAIVVALTDVEHAWSTPNKPSADVQTIGLVQLGFEPDALLGIGRVCSKPMGRAASYRVPPRLGLGARRPGRPETRSPRASPVGIVATMRHGFEPDRDE